MQLKDLIQMSYLIITADVTLLIFLHFNSVISGKRKAAFTAAGIISMAMLTCNFIVYAFRGTGTHLPLIWIANAVSYSISGPVILPFLFLTGVIHRRILRILQFLCGLNIALCMISCFHGLVFTIDSPGYVVLGPLGTLPFILSGLYLSVLLAASVIKFRLGFHGESTFIFILSIGIVVATILNTFYNYKFLISGMAVLSSTFYYVFFIAQTLSRDALTNALNRHSFYKDIESMKKRQLFLIAMDLNGLKLINDTKGHAEGDKAILAVSESTNSILPMRYRFYRMGGDEFEILCPSASAEEIAKIVKALKEAVQKKGYSVAIGYGEYTKGMDFDTVFTQVDAIMYADKARMKRESGEEMR